MPTPYDSQPPRSFWRTGVANLSPLEFRDLYRKKFTISENDLIGSAGSCFAQHIGNRLKRSGFRYLDVEPPPALLPAAEHGRYGYGIYSGRFGNIYTARQMRQLFERAFAEFEPVDHIWMRGDRFHDAFRPTIEPDGFGSIEELLAMRQGHLASVRTMFEKADVFVFTFGLTEAWMSRRDGAVYPLCPGTAAGTFSDTEYQFVNFGFSEIIADMSMLIQRWRAINPGIRFLFTVSPVPLTATATSSHVMVATTYSKSVLRAVAGELAQDELIDYFPSYELIASPTQRGFFFAPNMRAVVAGGVEYVMRHFFDQHTPPASSGARAPATTGGPAQATAPPMHEDDVICDEMLLDTHNAA
ncbi:GSCFA domain-containing protein [Limobrevibacterium gyesilva]|uniref:GSCFA domain-containing protein n=1 Tax=Limobrevibacterium gyesilva TaxID=2991712 RepID=A0AA42CFS4_9PROT|nr:GSCFA domain-containing protein [Limobrevibacterium gyesilva]MCW3477438.1 GSCFA domain-containing protein [Limobrevibacterium gyesilva]